MDVTIESSWKAELSKEFEQQYFKSLIEFVRNEYASNPDKIFPEFTQIFRAFDACSFNEVKVVILGQDPYPTKGHAHGLCFSVKSNVSPLPRSLNNIYKELQTDVGLLPRESGDLNHWAEQGVLMLNATLTVKEGMPESHANMGWEIFTDAVIQKLNEKKEGIVYLLWGSKAIRKAENVDRLTNNILTAPHPSPLSAYRGFFGCKHFSKTNEYLASQGEAEINW